MNKILDSLQGAWLPSSINQRADEKPDNPDIEADVDTVIEMFGGNLRAAIRSLLIANEFLTAEVERAKEAVSVGYTRRPRRPA